VFLKPVLLKKVRQCLETETRRRLTYIQKEALKHDGLKNAVKTVIEMIQR